MKLVLAITGASGAHAARALVAACPWPIALVVSDWGRDVYERECGPFDELAAQAAAVYDNGDLSAPLSSGSVPSRGMVVLPCSSDTLARVAGGHADTLIARAAHCHLKEGRRLVLCVRESPWTLIDLENARRVATAGGIVMPLSPPFYLFGDRPPEQVNLREVLSVFADRVLALFGRTPPQTWEGVQ